MVSPSVKLFENGLNKVKVFKTVVLLLLLKNLGGIASCKVKADIHIDCQVIKCCRLSTSVRACGMDNPISKAGKMILGLYSPSICPLLRSIHLICGISFFALSMIFTNSFFHDLNDLVSLSIICLLSSREKPINCLLGMVKFTFLECALMRTFFAPSHKIVIGKSADLLHSPNPSSLGCEFVHKGMRLLPAVMTTFAMDTCEGLMLLCIIPEAMSILSLLRLFLLR